MLTIKTGQTGHGILVFVLCLCIYGVLLEHNTGAVHTPADTDALSFSYAINSTILAENFCRRPIAVCPADWITCRCCVFPTSKYIVNNDSPKINLLVICILYVFHFWKRCKNRQDIERQTAKQWWPSYVYSYVIEIPAWTCCACVAPLFFLTDAENGLLFEEDLNISHTKPRRVKTKNKLAQTTGPLHKKLKNDSVKHQQMIGMIKKQKMEISSRLGKMVKKYHLTCQQSKVDLASKAKLTFQTRIHVLRLQRELIVLENTLTSLRTRLELQKLANRDVIERYLQIHELLVRASGGYNIDIETRDSGMTLQ